MMITPQATEAMEVCFTLQPETNTFRSAAVSMTGSGSALGRGPADSDHFLYRRRLSDGAVTAGGCLQMCSSSLSSVQEEFSSDSHSYISSSKAPPAWQQNSSIQVSSLSSHTCNLRLIARWMIRNMLKLHNGLTWQDCSKHTNMLTELFSLVFSYLQSLYPELPAAPGESPCILSQRYPSYCSSSPVQQVSQ